MSLLNSEQRAQFERDGYLIVRGLLDGDLISRSADAVQRAIDGGHSSTGKRLDIHRDDSSVLVWVKDPHSELAELQALMKNPQSAAIAAELLGGAQELRLLLDTIFYKASGSGGAVGWHQDYSYWQHFEPAQMVAAGIALTPSTVENGCLHVIPGSHKWGLMPGNWTDAFSEDPDHLLKMTEVQLNRDPGPAQPLELMPGDVAFHHCLTLHGSYNNATESRRMNYVIQYAPEQARYNASKVRFWQKDPDLTDGDPLQGPRHPILWRQSPSIE
jgi:ectoine hydroxylase-related dioxygenase (phytanoyl-CoA dioxygenase family)